MFHIEPAHARQSVQAPLLSLNRSLDNLRFTIYVFTRQGQCKPNAIELARIAEVQPVLAEFTQQR